MDKRFEQIDKRYAKRDRGEIEKYKLLNGSIFHLDHELFVKRENLDKKRCKAELEPELLKSRQKHSRKDHNSHRRDYKNR